MSQAEFDPFADDAEEPSKPNHPLANKTMIVCATKIDAANPEKLKKLTTHAKRRKLEFHAISAVTGEGIDELKWSLARHLGPRQVSGRDHN
jgi:GTP-binding protein